jgi:hypothetical protein
MGRADWLDLTEHGYPSTHPSLLVSRSVRLGSQGRDYLLLRFKWRSEDLELHEHALYAEKGECAELATLCPLVVIHHPKAPMSEFVFEWVA